MEKPSGATKLPEAVAVLRDGRAVRVRPIRPDDRDKWLDFFRRQSPQSRYLRFGYGKSDVSEEEIVHYTYVTPPERCAYVAVLGEGASERIIGIGRWDALEGNRAAEIAFAVEDHIQLRGIGTALLDHLAAVGREMGYEHFVASVLRENTLMQEVFEESGFRYEKRMDGGVYQYDIDLTSREEPLRRQVYREHVARAAGVRHLLYPRSIAVVGASRDSNKVGGAVFRNLLKSDFTGPVFPINPGAASIAGVMAYPSVKDVPADVDLAVVVVPAQQVPQVVEECAEKGVWGAVVITAGFSETGPAGADLEREVKDKLLAYGMRMIGPNCLGVLNTDQAVSMNATFASSVPPSGAISMGSHSGALGIALLDYAKSIDLGISQFVSLGNGADITATDLLQFWQDDERTSVILFYLESFGDPHRFSRAARETSQRKPVVVLKGGKSAAGAAAAASHTGALAASETVVEALFRQAGVTRVETIEEMFSVAQVLAYQPLPQGNRVAIVTNAGGPGILATDACESWGLAVRPLSEPTQQELRSFLPGEASVHNPVDLIASATAEQYGRALAAVHDDPNVDAVLLIHIPPLVTQPADVAQAIRATAAERKGEKPVVACFMMTQGMPSELALGDGFNIPSFVFPEDAVRAMAHACTYAAHLREPQGQPVRFTDVDANGARNIVEGASRRNGKGAWLEPEEALRLLAAYGIPTTDTAVAHSASEAAEAARGLGFPVVMKLRSSTLIHKSDVGGVALDLRSPEVVVDAYAALEARLKAAGRLQEMDGVVLQRMAPPGQEVILGMTQAPTFGPLVMVGLGGVQVELLRDVMFSLHPLLDTDPSRMLRELKSYPLLTGFRGSRARDVAKLEEVMLRFSMLVEGVPGIAGVEINPLFVFDESDGCLAVDARVRLE